MHKKQSPLTHRAFLLFWLGSSFSSLGTKMQQLLMAWHVWKITEDPQAVAIMGLCKFVPVMAFVLFGGLIADRFNRRMILLLTQILWALSCLMMWFLSYFDQITALLIYVFTVIIEIVDAFDGPARKSMIAKVVPKEILSSAVSFQAMTKNAIKLCAPVLMGMIVLYVGIEWSYFANGLCFLMVFISVFLIPNHHTQKNITHHHRHDRDVKKKVSQLFFEIKEGFVYLKNSPVLLSILILDFFANFWANATVMLPAFSSDILKLDVEDFGILASAVAFGGLIASFGLVMSHEPKHKGKLVVAGSFLYAISSIGFAFSFNLWSAFICLALLGFADQISTVLRNTIHQNATPDEIRGRVTSINSLFTKGGPRLGELQAGLISGILGISLGIATGALISILFTLLVVILYRPLIEYRDEGEV